MSAEQRPPNGPPDVGRVARELLGEFLDDAHDGQVQAIAAAAKRAVRSEKAAPVRQLARELDDANGNIFTRAISALLSRRTRTGDDR